MTSAGEVVYTFADFVTKGSLAVGVIIFIIIVVIQFVVITKGATRISEVAARFTLDAMPGKQMAIDADLNAGNHQRSRRPANAASDIAQEADFYGAMDGASKFVRGDAIAGIIITFVNVLGGLYVGMFEHGWALMDCLPLYTQADHRRRSGQPDAGVHHLAGRRPDRHAHQQQEEPRRRNAQPGLRQAQGAGDRGDVPRPDDVHGLAEDSADDPGRLLRRAWRSR